MKKQLACVIHVFVGEVVCNGVLNRDKRFVCNPVLGQSMASLQSADL